MRNNKPSPTNYLQYLTNFLSRSKVNRDLSKLVENAFFVMLYFNSFLFLAMIIKTVCLLQKHCLLRGVNEKFG